MARRERGRPPAHHGSHPVDRRPGRRPATRTATPLELTFQPGQRDALADEAAEVLLLDGPPEPVKGREDAIVVSHWGPLAPVRDLRTADSACILLRFDIPRPKSLTSDEHLQRIVAAVKASLDVARAETFRIEAAESESAVVARLAEQLADATDLRYDPAGDMVLRLRRGQHPGPSGDPGWDVLVSLGTRPPA